MKPTYDTLYEKPVLTRQGSVEELTHGSQTGSELDADFTAGAGRDDLTFS